MADSILDRHYAYDAARRADNSNSSETQPPASSGGLPKIGGSSTGFIVLVVSLAAIILICCIGIFILLRGHKNDPFERHARRVLAGNRQDTPYQKPLGPPGMRQKFGRLFGFWRRRREGWVRASSGENDDEWDASYHPTYDHARELTDRDMRWINDAPPTRYPTVVRSDSHDSVALSASIEGEGETPVLTMPVPALDNFAAMTGSPYTDPFSSTPPAAEASYTSPPVEPPDDKRFSVQSLRDANGTPTVRSMQKFENGTKFKESLEF